MGLWGSIKKSVKKAVKGVVRVVTNVVKAVVSVVRRIIKVLDLIGSLLGIQPRKRMMLRMLILKDERGQPVVDQKEVERWVDVAKSVLRDRCNIDLIPPRLSDETARKNVEAGLPTAFSFVAVLEPIPPVGALSVPAEASSAWNGELDYFMRLAAADFAKPTVNGFVIRSVSNGGGGFAWGMITDIFVADPASKSTVIPHETGHLCWLFHRNSANNLMTPDRADMDSKLTRWQVSVIRSSKYAHY
jgi:hypothetical protein